MTPPEPDSSSSSPRRPCGPTQLLAAYAGSLRFLRVTWMLWIAGFLVLFAYPVVLLSELSLRLDEPGYLVECRDPALVHSSDPWIEFPYGGNEVWLRLVLAVLLPPAVHWLLVRRVNSPFLLRRAAESPTHDYRSPRPWVVETSPRVVRRLVTLYAGRLALALASSLVVLRETAFVPVFSFCCFCTRCEMGWSIEGKSLSHSGSSSSGSRVYPGSRSGVAER